MVTQGKCNMCKGSVPLRGTSCAYGEMLAALAFRLRRTLAPSALDARASRSLYLLVTHTRTEPLTKARVYHVFRLEGFHKAEIKGGKQNWPFLGR